MKIIRIAIAAGLVAAASLVACSSQHGATSTGAGNNNGNTNVGNTGAGQGNVGKVGLSWLVATGINVTDLKYTITGSGTTAGNNYGPLDANIGDAGSAEWVAGGITAGCGYTLSVSGNDSNNDPCSGTTGTFCVGAGTTTYEQISVVCFEPTDGQVAADVNQGSVAVEAGITVTPVAPYSCPGINSFSIVPAELLGTQPAAVSILTTGTVSAISWTASACNNVPGVGPGTGAVGGFTDPTAASTSFNCGSCTGQVTVSANVAYDQIQPGSDSGTNVCAGAPFTTFTGLINCEGGGTLSCFSPQIACGGACVNAQTDNSNCGMCGITCTSPQSCQTGSCACPSGQTAIGGTCCPSGDNAVCGGTCTNTNTDVNNCGGCGATFACPSGDSCVAGACSAPPPVPCTLFNGTAATGPHGELNCVQCTAKSGSNGVCTGTEQLIVTRDIAKHLLTGAGGTTGQLDPVNSCFACAATNACIDTAAHLTKNCEDLAGNVGTGAAGSKTNTQLCLDTLACIIGDAQQDGYSWTNNATFVSCANDPAPGDGISNCYCGPAFPNVSACSGATATTVNGTCDTVIFDGLGGISGTTTPTTILSENTAPTLAAGRADAILKCAGTNAATAQCPQCF